MISKIHKEVLFDEAERDILFGRKIENPEVFLSMHISREIETQNNIINTASKEISQEFAESIQYSTQRMCGSIEEGFEVLMQNHEKSTQNIVDSINAIGADISWKLSMISEQLKITNLLLENISELLKIPDTQKERFFNIEQGIKYYSNARYDEDLYEYSREYFTKALEVEDKDPFTLQKLGIIHLISHKHYDVEVALKFFSKSLKFILPEVFNSDKLDLKKIMLSEFIDPKDIAIRNYLYIGKCQYLLGDMESAIKTLSKAYELDENNKEILYDYCKYLTFSNSVLLGDLIKKLIILYPKSIMSIVNDFDMISNKTILSVLKKLCKQKKESLDLILNLVDKNDPIFTQNVTYYDKYLNSKCSYLELIYIQETILRLDLTCDINSCKIQDFIPIRKFGIYLPQITDHGNKTEAISLWQLAFNNYKKNSHKKHIKNLQNKLKAYKSNFEQWEDKSVKEFYSFSRLNILKVLFIIVIIIFSFLYLNFSISLLITLITLSYGFYKVNKSNADWENKRKKHIQKEQELKEIIKMNEDKTIDLLSENINPYLQLENFNPLYKIKIKSLESGDFLINKFYKERINTSYQSFGFVIERKSYEFYPDSSAPYYIKDVFVENDQYVKKGETIAEIVFI